MSTTAKQVSYLRIRAALWLLAMVANTLEASEFCPAYAFVSWSCCWLIASPFFGVMGATASIVFCCFGAAYGTAKSGVGIAAMGVMRPELIMKSVVPVVMVNAALSNDLTVYFHSTSTQNFCLFPSLDWCYYLVVSRLVLLAFTDWSCQFWSLAAVSSSFLCIHF